MQSPAAVSFTDQQDVGTDQHTLYILYWLARRGNRPAHSVHPSLTSKTWEQTSTLCASFTDLEDVGTDQKTLSLGDGGSKVHEHGTVPWVPCQHQDLRPETTRFTLKTCLPTTVCRTAPLVIRDWSQVDRLYCTSNIARFNLDCSFVALLK